MSKTWWLFIAPLVLAAVLVATQSLGVTHANGRVARFINRTAGPYEVALGTIPDTPVVGSLHLTMTIAEASSGESMLNAEVTVVGSGPDTEAVEIGPLTAQPNPVDPLFYDINTSVDRVGVWTFTVAVRADPGEGSADSQLKVEKPGALTKYLTWVTVIVFFALIGLGLLPYLRERGRRKMAGKRP